LFEPHDIRKKQLQKIDIDLKMNMSQRDIIASLILLIFIVIAVLLLVSGNGPDYELDIPVGLIKEEISAQKDIDEEKLTSEHKGISYEKKLTAEETEIIRLEQQRETAITEVKSLKYVPSSSATAKEIENSKEYKKIQGSFKWDGSVINESNGTISGPSGKETYYNLPMGGVVSIMRGMGNRDTYWVRSDGCKMLGYYIMVAANFSRHPEGSIVKCSRGYAIVCDTGTFARANPDQLDIAVDW
jgi:hypothetical protein